MEREGERRREERKKRRDRGRDGGREEGERMGSLTKSTDYLINKIKYTNNHFKCSCFKNSS